MQTMGNCGNLIATNASRGFWSSTLTWQQQAASSNHTLAGRWILVVVRRLPTGLLARVTKTKIILMIFWDFSTALGFTQNGPIKRKYSMSSTSLGENASLMSEENELTGRQQWLKYLLTQGIQKSISERTTPQTFKQMTCRRRPHWPHS